MEHFEHISNKNNNFDELESPDPKKQLRDLVNLILPDSLMIILAVIMVPIILVPIFIELPSSFATSFQFIDYTILGIFIIEYFSKTVLAQNILKHVINPWHLLDLLIVLLPLISLMPDLSGSLGYSPLLRLLRITRVLAVGGRAMDRKKQISLPVATVLASPDPMEIRVMNGTLDNIAEQVSISQFKKYLQSPDNTWIDISCVSERDYETLSDILNIPKLLLESELVDDAYPRADYFENFSTIFARIAEVKIAKKGPTRLFVNRAGLLVICQGQNIITLSKIRTGIFEQILEKAKTIHAAEDPIVVSILYSILKYILERDKLIISALEQELIKMENTPLKDRPTNFLEATFYLRKEVNQLVPSLLHLKEIITVITSKRVPLKGFSERHEKIFDILMDEASYLHETASNARDDLLSLIDLYINTTSYEINKVMRVIAVITSLSIIPAVMGLLGSNILGNPWNIHLWQVFAVLGILMVAMGWVFYRLGWLKG